VRGQNAAKFLVLLTLSVALAALTYVFATIPMRVMRKTYGSGAFWAGQFLVTAGFIAGGLWTMGLAYLALAILVGTYSEIEEHGAGVFASSATAVFATLGLAAVGAAFWIQKTQAHVMDVAKTQLAALAEQATKVNPQLQIDMDALMAQLPSGVVIVLIVSLACALIWEKRAAMWMKLPSREEIFGQNLSAFRIPDFMVWVAIVCLLGAFMHGLPGWTEKLAINGLNIVIVLYFFQGIAVASQAFRVYKIGVFWQSLWFFIFTVQLFPLVSLIGFTDYWLEYRVRLVKKAPQIKSGFKF
jgi:hypothetical protein